MAQKSKQHVEPAQLGERVAKARREGRTQQALELSRQLYKHDPTEKNLDLLRQATFERGVHLQSVGYLKDAATVFSNAIDMGGPPEFLATLAEKLASCGATGQAFKLIERLPEGADSKVMGQAVDSAIRQGAAGRAQLPANLHQPFELVLQAFAQAEKGEDEAARTTLQGIGLQSPFLEWKMLLRGFIAWYAKDDARALDNWQRLDAARLPWRIAAPFRAGIDSAFRQAQTAATQDSLRQLADQFSGSGLILPLKMTQDLLAKKDVAGALRQVSAILPALRKDHADIARRLELCFFWAIVHDGEPRDVGWFARAFGAPPDDPDLDRLQGLATEKRGLLEQAESAWQSLEQQIAAHPEAWPGDQGRYARAILWEHLAGLAEEDSPADFFGEGCTIDTETCFRRSIELVPNRLAPQVGLFEFLLERNKVAKAKKVGQALLEQFPEHVQTLETLGDLAIEKKPEDTLAYFERALKANPLEKRLRIKLAKAHDVCALRRCRSLVEPIPAADLEAIRVHWETALRLMDGAATAHLLARLILLETRAGQPERATPWLAQLQTLPDQRAASAYTLLVENIRFGMSNSTRTYLDQFNSQIAQPLAARELLCLLSAVSVERLDGDYPGQKAYEKKVFSLVRKPLLDKLTESELMAACETLKRLGNERYWKVARTLGLRKFRDNPYFPLFEIDAIFAQKQVTYFTVVNAESYLRDARERAAKLPREQQDALMPEIEKRAELMKTVDQGPMSMLERLFGMGL